MPSSKQNISYETIEEAILKAFALAGRKKYPKLEDVIHYLDVSSICSGEYRSIYYPKNSLIKSLLYMEFNQQSQSQFERDVGKKASKKKKLGLGLHRKRPPDQTTISKFKKKMVNEEVESLLHFTVQKIRELAKKEGISFENGIEETKKRRSRKERDEISISWILRNVSRRMKRRIISFIPIDDSAQNVKYQKKAHLQVYLYMAQGNDFANGAIKDLREEKKLYRMFCPHCNHLLFPLSDWLNEEKYENIMICSHCGYEKSLVPDPDTVFYHLKKSKGDDTQKELEKLQRSFSNAKEVIYEMINETEQLQKPVNIKIGFKDDFVDISFDYTEWFYYGNINAKPLRGHVSGKKPERGTSYCFKFLAADAIGSRKRLTFDAVLFRETKKMELLRKLLTYVKERAKIGVIIVDKGFWDHKILQMFDDFHVNYLMLCKRPSKKNEITIDEMQIKGPVPWYYPDQKLKNVSYNKIAVKKKIRGKEVTLAFATNKNFSNIAEAEKFTNLYPLRWGIESGFRVKKHAFLPRTTSRDMRVRSFFFFFTVLLYNLWYLADTLVWLKRYKKVGERRIVTANHFRTIFKIIMEDPG